MLGRKDYTTEELANGRAAVKEALAGFRKLAKLVPDDQKATAALGSFETTFFNDMVLVLDRYYVHRIRAVSGKDGNALNEVELLTESLMNNGGVLQGNNVIKYVPEESATGLKVGDPIRLSAAQFEQLADAFFDELTRRFG